MVPQKNLLKEIMFSIIFNLIPISVVEKILMPLIRNKNFRAMLRFAGTST